MGKFSKILIISLIFLSMPVFAKAEKAVVEKHNPVYKQEMSVAKAVTDEQTEATSSVSGADSKIERINKETQALGKRDDIPRHHGTGNYYLRALSGLSIVLILIFAFAWVYAKIKGINPSAILAGKFAEKDLNKINILSTSMLGQGKELHLVEINGKQLVIGSTAANINLLTEISQEEVEKLKAKKHEQAESSSAEQEEVDAEAYSNKYGEFYKKYKKD